MDEKKPITTVALRKDIISILQNAEIVNHTQNWKDYNQALALISKYRPDKTTYKKAVRMVAQYVGVK